MYVTQLGTYTCITFIAVIPEPLYVGLCIFAIFRKIWNNNRVWYITYGNLSLTVFHHIKYLKYTEYFQELCYVISCYAISLIISVPRNVCGFDYIKNSVNHA